MYKRTFRVFLFDLTLVLSIILALNIAFGENLSVKNISFKPSQNQSLADKSLVLAGDNNEFLFLMNQYWIPDFYEIKGRIEGAMNYDIPEMVNLSTEYAIIRLNKNLNETRSYNISTRVSDLRGVYQDCARRSQTDIRYILSLNRSDPNYQTKVYERTARLSLYGSWLGYQVMDQYKRDGSSYPALATLPAKDFFTIISNMT